MSSDSPQREQALSRIAALEHDLGALALEATRLRGEIAAVHASVEAIPTAAPRAQAVAAAGRADEHALAGARIVALDLVLGGVPRDEAVLRMAVEFPDLDVAALVDEAVAAGG